VVSVDPSTPAWRPTLSIPQSLALLKTELAQQLVLHLVERLLSALDQAQPVHEVEQALGDLLLQAGRRALGAFLEAHGTGDQGPIVTLPDGQQVQRLEEGHRRRYVSIFGAFDLARTVYGTRARQALQFVPLDNRLQLPAGDFSYLRPAGDQALAVEQAFSQVNQTIARMLKLRKAKRTALRRIGRYFAKNRARMRYDVYLREGYPIASGVIEGACRPLIKDRMERAGMYWTVAGAQAMLDLRSVWIGGQWQAFVQDRIEREPQRLDPHRDLVAGEAFFAMAA
jgi:hypothetical protein